MHLKRLTIYSVERKRKLIQQVGANAQKYHGVINKKSKENDFLKKIFINLTKNEKISVIFDIVQLIINK